MELDRGRGGRALYRQIADLVRDHIATHRLTPGDQLPSEPALAERFDVARATVGKALDTLGREGLVVRRQGSGTFVALPPMARQLPELTSFSEHVESLGRKAGQRLVAYRHVEDPGDDPLLAAFVDGPLVVVRRLRLIDGEPVGLHRTGLPAALAEEIGFTRSALQDEDASLYRLFRDGGVELTSAEEHLRAVNADPEQAGLLEVAPGTALMGVRRLTRDRDGRLVEAVDASYLGDVYDYRIDLTRAPPTRHREHGNERDDPNDPDAVTRGGPRIDGRGLRR